MEKQNLNEILSILFLMGIILTAGCEKEKSLSPGFLQGTISIGPICPVETIPPDPACQPTAETYKAYPVSVYTPDGKNKISQLNPSLDGSFKSELPPGQYLIVLEKKSASIGGTNLPVEVTITSNDNTFISINIDTGIR
jgi:hypothetical protein